MRINGNGLEEEILAVEKYLAQLDPETAQRVELGGLNAEEVIEHFAESSLAVMASDFRRSSNVFLGCYAGRNSSHFLSFLVGASRDGA